MLTQQYQTEHTYVISCLEIKILKCVKPFYLLTVNRAKSYLLPNLLTSKVKTAIKIRNTNIHTYGCVCVLLLTIDLEEC